MLAKNIPVSKGVESVLQHDAQRLFRGLHGIVLGNEIVADAICFLVVGERFLVRAVNLDDEQILPLVQSLA